MTQIAFKDHTFDDGKVTVFDGRRTYSLRYYTRSGRFNLMSNEESLSCHLEITDDLGNRVISTNISPEYEYEGTDVEEAIYAVEEDIKSYCFDGARTNKETFINFLKTHQEAIERGNDLKELKDIDKQLEKLKSRRNVLLGRS